MTFRYHHLLVVALSCLTLVFGSCDDDISQVGNSIVGDQLKITVDSTLHRLKAETVFDKSFDGRSSTLLLGSLQTPQYGTLDCGFVAQLMPAYALNIPDSISQERIDSVRIVLRATRGQVTGDSLLPQRFSVFALQKRLPAGISSSFNPSGYYNPDSPLTSGSYTFSKMAEKDSSFFKGTALRISAPLPKQWGKEIWDAYKKNPTVFQWPATFAEHFPGIYVKQTFGSGAVAKFNNLSFVMYYYKLATINEIVDGVNVTREIHRADSVTFFTTAPEILSSNVVDYQPSQYVTDLVNSGKKIVSTPGGFITKIEFPLQELLNKYYAKDFNLSVVGNLTLQIPATTIPNTLGLTNPPYLLMVRTSKIQDFFANNRVPDGKDSFWASYDSETGAYRFTSMRNYFIDAINRKTELTADDTDFSILPVTVKVEKYTDPNTYKETSAVTSCKPYIGVPSVTVLDTERALICLTFTNQVID